MVKKLVKLVTNNFGLKIMALLFAMILWFVVVNIDDPTQTRNFTTSVSVENSDAISSMGKYYEIVNDSNTVTFRVSAKRSILRMLSNTDFRAVADMSRIEELSRVPIEITATRYTSSVSFQSKQLYLEVAVEDLQTKQLVISAAYEGTPAENCAVGDVVVQAPNVIKISGPASVVSTVESAKATVNVDGISTSITDSVVPTLLDAQGNVVDTTKLKLNVQTVNVSAEILDIKSVSVSALINGLPKDGYTKTAVLYSPETVSIKGAAALLNTVNSIEIPAGIINISGAQENVVQTVDISEFLPEGVTLTHDADKKIEVTVVIEQIATRTLELPTKNITIQNIPEGYRASFVEDTANISISGLSSDLEKLVADDIKATVDAGGLGEGEYTVALVLELDEELYKTAGTQTVMIRLEERTSSTDDGDGNKTDTGKTDSGKTDTGKTDSGKTDTGKTDSGKTDTGKTDSGKTDTGKTDSGKTDQNTTGGGDEVVPDTEQ